MPWGFLLTVKVSVTLVSRVVGRDSPSHMAPHLPSLLPLLLLLPPSAHPSLLQWVQGIRHLPAPIATPPRVLLPSSSSTSCRPCHGRLLFSPPSAPCCPHPSCTCGLARTRIVGGSGVAVRGKYPWIAAINFRGNQGRRPGGCAATLIAANWALTAAHCIGLQYRWL